MAQLHLNEKVEVLKKIELFSDFTDYVLKEIANVMEEIEVKKGITIINKNEDGNCMYVLYSGSVKIHDEDNKIAELHSVNIIGEMSLLTSEPRNASVTSIEDCKLLSLNQQAFDVISEDNLEFYKAIVRVLIKKLQRQNFELIEFSKNARRIMSLF